MKKSNEEKAESNPILKKLLADVDEAGRPKCFGLYMQMDAEWTETHCCSAACPMRMECHKEKNKPMPEKSRNEMVSEFIEKMGKPKLLKDKNKVAKANSTMLDASIAYHEAVNTIPNTLHGYRAKLILEEVAELLLALANGSETDILDALADLSYVIEGAAIMLDLPLDKAFKEVHRSNMTKQPFRAANNKKKPQSPVKGSSFSPPELAKLIEEHRREHS